MACENFDAEKSSRTIRIKGASKITTSHYSVIPDKDAFWKDDWDVARTVMKQWWKRKGVALHVTAPADRPIGQFSPPSDADLSVRWLSPRYRIDKNFYHLSRTFHGGVAFPLFDADIGPGSLGLFLDGEGRLAPDTVWYEPTIFNPDQCYALKLNFECDWWRRHISLIEGGLEESNGRYIVGMPDLIENLDTLAQLRGPQTVLMDLIERPEWCMDRIHDTNQAFFQSFQFIYDLIQTEWGGNAVSAFQIWGPGMTMKVQCDICCCISPSMFRKFVQPCLEEQCDWLDYSLFHLDGTQAISQLDNLLSIESLDAIEFTPQSGLPGGGSSEWYHLYRRIKAGGKSVQAVGVKPEEVLPLIDAVGEDGMLIMTSADTETHARHLLDQIGWGKC